MVGPEEVLSFWLDDVGEAGWYAQDDALDAEIKRRFKDVWEAARQGLLSHWLVDPKGYLAFVILTDQFPRNMFRGSKLAFASDRDALAAAKVAVDRCWDLKIGEPERQFFYLPMMHSESLCDQDRCVRLMCERMPESGEPNLLHARAHREVIRQFGRFPYRNEALARDFTPPEAAYVSAGGYGETVRELQSAG
ncbi:DUF924 family protein [Sedimentitalea sp. HM32M-2]|uniref:DUF924 family protein n=1 Tax=Sedimentitalea sp. HM32M-2 TaxID=3351566 RepID=UPI00362CDCE2